MASQTTAAPRLDGEVARELAERTRGPVLVPGGAGYDEARALFNGLIDRRPALIVQCSGAADAIEAVTFAREHELPLSVKGGGHGIAGNAMNDGGIVVDLSPLRSVRVDPAARRVRAGGGATWGDCDRETQVFGLAVPGGLISTTGIAGLTLHGGVGHLRRKHGLSLDNLVSVDIVTADGQLRTASATENDDLFWAVRGAGSNFGVVTSFEFQAHPVGPVVMVAAPIYRLGDAATVVPAWRDFMETAPDDVSSLVVFWSVPADEHFPEEHHGAPVVVVAAVHAGPVDEGERVLQPLRELGEPLLDLSEPWPWVGLQAGFDPYWPKGVFGYWKSRALPELSQEAIDEMIRLAASRPSPQSDLALWHHGGAMSRVGETETAYGGRDAPFLVSVEATWTEPSLTDEAIAWAREGWDSLARYSTGGLYLNFAGFGEEQEALVKAGYGRNYERLTQLKAEYDPDNLFRSNLNITPAS